MKRSRISMMVTLQAMKTARLLLSPFTRSATDVPASTTSEQGYCSQSSPRSIRHMLSMSQATDDYTQFGPVLECVCGSDLFIALVSFDDDRELSTYFTDGRCAQCWADVTLPTAADELPGEGETSGWQYHN